MKKTYVIYTLFINCTMQSVGVPYTAVVSTPVADLAGQPLSEQNQSSAEKLYQKLPLCGNDGTYACFRVHQALFHEQVTIVQERGDEVKIQMMSFFFETQKEPTQHNTFWSLKKNFTALEELKQNNVDLAQLPEPIDYQNACKQTQSIVTLTKPYEDPITKQTFSVGTRFVITAPKTEPEDQNYVIVYALEPENKHITTCSLPKEMVVQTNQLSFDQKLELYVQLIRNWTRDPQGFIPYVWGGSSITHTYKNHSFKLCKSNDHNGSPISFFKEDGPHTPCTGLDCAGLVGRAAQTAGLPYYFKNTTTLAKHLAPHTASTSLQNGDLVWFPGHVMVVGDIEKNTIIEARHYKHGYGKVHEIPLNNAFKGITTFTQLKRAYLQQKPLVRLNKAQKVLQTIEHFKLLQMKSIATLPVESEQKKGIS